MANVDRNIQNTENTADLRVTSKQCAGPCRQEYPATEEYWHKHTRGKYGLHPQCKECRKKTRDSQRDNHPNSPTGQTITGEQSVFRKPLRRNRNLPEGYKICTGPCGRTLPAINEFFHHNKSSRDGLMPRCKKCKNEYKLAHYTPTTMRHLIPDGYKRCNGPCGRTLPATLEFWYPKKRGKHGIYSKCKECCSKRMKEYNSMPEKKEHRLERQKAYGKEYHARPEIKEAKNEYQRERYNSRPEIREKIRKEQKEYYDRPGVKKRILERAKERYSSKGKNGEHDGD